MTDNAAAAGHKLSAETLAGIDEALGDAVVETAAPWSAQASPDVPADLT